MARIRPSGDPAPRALGRIRMSTTQAWRGMTAGLRPLPDFVILGAMRSGTTSLYEWLARHPQMAPPTTKEIRYFDVDHARGPRWYRSHFPLALARAGRVTGEASPYMLFYHLSPPRVADELPTAKLIVVLRDPVQRAISHYWFSRRMHVETEPIEAAIALEPERLAGEVESFRRGGKSPNHRYLSYLARGEYAAQLRRWFEYVDPGRILVLESEKLFTDADSRRSVTDWLGISPTSEPLQQVNRRLREPTDPAVIAILEAHFAPHNEELFELLGRRLWGQ